MKEEQIVERIQNLQADIKYSFKQTSEVIDIIYRQGVNDEKKFGVKQPYMVVKQQKDSDIVVMSSKDLNDAFGTKPNDKKFRSKRATSEDEQLKIEHRIQKVKRDIYLELLQEIEKKNDLMDVYIYVKEKCKEYGEPGVRNKFNNRERKRENPWM